MSLDILLVIFIIYLIVLAIYTILKCADYDFNTRRVLVIWTINIMIAFGFIMFINCYDHIIFKDGEYTGQGIIVRYDGDDVFLRQDEEGSYIKLRLSRLKYSSEVPKGRFIKKKFYVGPIYKAQYFISE